MRSQILLACLTLSVVLTACDRGRDSIVSPPFKAAGTNQKQIVNEVLELGGFVLAHAVWKADGDIGETVIPFSISQTHLKRQSVVYATDRLETGVELGRRQLEELKGKVDAWALAYITVNKISGEEYVEVDIWHKKGFEARIRQAYQPHTAARPFRLIGEPSLSINGEPVVDKELYAAVFRGIDSHDQARGYWKR